MYTACLTLTASNSRTKLTFDINSTYSAFTIIHRVFYQIYIIITLPLVKGVFVLFMNRIHRTDLPLADT